MSLFEAGSSVRSTARVVALVHPCLEPLPHAVPLASARLKNRQRLGVVLQAAGLLALLERAGWRVMDWNAALVDNRGRLTLAEGGIEPGRGPWLPQEVLRDVLARLFVRGWESGLPGRGDARRATRALRASWSQSLAPISLDEAVARVLEKAAFLWEPAFAAVRTALAGEIRLAEGGGERVRLCVAGPGPFRRRMLAQCRTLEELQARLAAPEAREDWDAAEQQGEPRDLARARRWRAAVQAWARKPPRSDEERVELAGALAALGRFTAALAELSGLRTTTEARVLRAGCQLQMGQLASVRAALLKLEDVWLPTEQAVVVAEIAPRMFASLGETELSERWVRRALTATADGPPVLALRARLAAAMAAWDRGDSAAMDLQLAQARAAVDHREVAWLFHQACALREEDGPRAAAHATRALGVSRRFLTRHQAGGLWNDLGLARARAGDLAGAERAFVHAARLLGGCDGPRKTTLALFNLAEIRLRRGRLLGVREILERSTAENRLSRNLRGQVQDSELWIRLELVLGRPEAALSLCRDTLRRKLKWRREELHLLAARALGWLGRPREAFAALARSLPGALLELEPEERPAVFAQAGDLAAARRQVEALPEPGLRELWGAVLSGRIPTASQWMALGPLEPYRAARLVFDAEKIAAGAAPSDVLRSAVATLRAVGAGSLAEVLETRDRGPWHALTAYLQGPGGPEAISAVFAAAGCPEAEVLREQEGQEGDVRRLVAGEGGGREISLPVPGEPGACLILRAREVAGAPAALLALLAWEAARPSEGPDPLPEADPVVENVSRETGPGDMVGESAALRTALARLDRLAAGDVPVLVLGESGTGKELAARRLHQASPRSRAPFVAVNCAALSETLILSDLFGHSRGAFTGADRERAGVFETAQGGTVFLDEIGDLPLVAQGLLLRVLQEGEVRRLGESLSKKVNVRVLAATHRDLDAMVAAGTFRQDLYFRLKVGRVELPPLRDRGEDVLRLADAFLSRLRRAGLRLSREARARLFAHAWPGNVRELQNVLSMAAALTEDGVIGPEHLELPHAEPAPQGSYHEQVEAFRRRLIESTLAACGGNMSESARRLGLSRQSFAYLARQYALR